MLSGQGELDVLLVATGGDGLNEAEPRMVVDDARGGSRDIDDHLGYYVQDGTCALVDAISGEREGCQSWMKAFHTGEGVE